MSEFFFFLLNLIDLDRDSLTAFDVAFVVEIDIVAASFVAFVVVAPSVPGVTFDLAAECVVKVVWVESVDPLVDSESVVVSLLADVLVVAVVKMFVDGSLEEVVAGVVAFVIAVVVELVVVALFEWTVVSMS